MTDSGWVETGRGTSRHRLERKLDRGVECAYPGSSIWDELGMAHTAHAGPTRSRSVVGSSRVDPDALARELRARENIVRSFERDDERRRWDESPRMVQRREEERFWRSVGRGLGLERLEAREISDRAEFDEIETLNRRARDAEYDTFMAATGWRDELDRGAR